MGSPGERGSGDLGLCPELCDTDAPPEIMRDSEH